MQPAAPRDAQGDDAALRGFLVLLEAENHALLHGDAPEVERLALQKSGMLGALATMPVVRLAKHRGLLERLRGLNADNGRLIAWRQSRGAERLAALGVAMPQTYDAAGLSRVAVSRGPFAKAFG
jgi:flagellar biosynthesis/type III secretory pathway chaperone